MGEPPFTLGLTIWPPGDLYAILKNAIFNFVLLIGIFRSSHDNALRWMPQTSLMISQHWFRSWLCAIRQQAITWANVDSVPCHLMASLGQSELINVCFVPRRHSPFAMPMGLEYKHYLINNIRCIIWRTKANPCKIHVHCSWRELCLITVCGRAVGAFTLWWHNRKS